MKRLALLIGFLLLIAACGTLPSRLPLQDPQHDLSLLSQCRGIYHSGRHQFWHLITATLPGGTQRRMMGVVVVDADARRIDWALMTVEGLVIFQGHDDNGVVKIARAVPPFDGPGFARGLIADLKFIWLPPALTDEAHTGRLSQGLPGCRLSTETGESLDIARPALDGWTVWQYDARKKLKRTLVARSAARLTATPGESTEKRPEFPQHLLLTRHGLGGYVLEMQLMEAIALKETP